MSLCWLVELDVGKLCLRDGCWRRNNACKKGMINITFRTFENARRSLVRLSGVNIQFGKICRVRKGVQVCRWFGERCLTNPPAFCFASPSALFPSALSFPLPRLFPRLSRSEILLFERFFKIFYFFSNYLLQFPGFLL